MQAGSVTFLAGYQTHMGAKREFFNQPTVELKPVGTAFDLNPSRPSLQANAFYLILSE